MPMMVLSLVEQLGEADEEMAGRYAEVGDWCAHRILQHVQVSARAVFTLQGCPAIRQAWAEAGPLGKLQGPRQHKQGTGRPRELAVLGPWAAVREAARTARGILGAGKPPGLLQQTDGWMAGGLWAEDGLFWLVAKGSSRSTFCCLPAEGWAGCAGARVGGWQGTSGLPGQTPEPR